MDNHDATVAVWIIYFIVLFEAASTTAALLYLRSLVRRLDGKLAEHLSLDGRYVHKEPYPECLTTAERVLVAGAFAGRRREVAKSASLCRRTLNCPSCYLLPSAVKHASCPTICARTVLHVIDNT